ncbi:hypothetical protein [Clostridium septicum]|uniref:Uncharacterized protein n=1 Tax=Clostridium septicum TaxID=1504 RepID=A0A9N7PKG5_CLOSE|nr:hypothetical protein [Clostridium septicum]AYE34002.1 hypothetical protein CP523_05735 [Clostridium septicum]MDU1315306.1 hypothetical protein [Clostridium septicum]UEC21375.1 hypothetical protein LK444_03085 [Clostridium septicum]USS00581.1 hypothetical protein NH397_14015 [Clostridium septicum]WLF69121.1 hypothetical protein Q6375_14245 [Clostridium septicum]
MINKVKLIISDRSKLHDEDDYNIEICRERLIEILSKDEESTILILNELNEKEILLASEVFEEVAYNLQSNRYIECLKSISLKYPNLNLEESIEVAEEYMD